MQRDLAECYRKGKEKMSLELNKATKRDLDFLVEMRVEALKAMKIMPEDEDTVFFEEQVRQYYEKHLDTESHIEYLAYLDGAFAGCGMACISDRMPTYHNPMGKTAYILNIYTREAFRRRGIGEKVVTQLLRDIEKAGVYQVELYATEAGKPLYDKLGFTLMQDEMQLMIPMEREDC